jgi:hypothetical protein
MQQDGPMRQDVVRPEDQCGARVGIVHLPVAHRAPSRTALCEPLQPRQLTSERVLCIPRASSYQPTISQAQ